MRQNEGVNELLTPTEVEATLLIPERTLGQWRYLGKGPVWLKLGRHVRYRRADVEEWLRLQQRGGPSAPA
jgi:predicted DNA-binding transcriptional regulator AlpA